jgi:hypothetical protein
MHPAPAVFLPGRVAQHPLSAPAISLFKNESAALRIEQVRRISVLRHFLTMEQDGFYSEMREIEKSVYIAADAELLRYDADDSLDYGRAWGGASAGDIVGAANVCVSLGRHAVLTFFSSFRYAAKCKRGTHVKLGTCARTGTTRSDRDSTSIFMLRV